MELELWAIAGKIPGLYAICILFILNLCLLYWNCMSSPTEKRVMVQKEKGVLEPLPDSRSQEEKDDEERNLINVLNPGNEGPQTAVSPVVTLLSGEVRPTVASPALQVGGVSTTDSQPLQVSSAHPLQQGLPGAALAPENGAAEPPPSQTLKPPGGFRNAAFVMPKSKIRKLTRNWRVRRLNQTVCDQAICD